MPLIDGWAPAFGRALAAASDLGIFEALKSGPRRAEDVAAACGTHPRATEKLMNLMVSQRFLTERSGAYGLRPVARKWLLADAPGSVKDMIGMKALEWQWIAHFDEFVRTGRPLDIHGSMSARDWELYQRGMRAQASQIAGEVARRTPVPAGASEMLDIGGSHGYFSVAFCRRHPGLRATVLDLAEAVAHAAPMLAREDMGDRVVHRVGDALTDDLGEARYDFIFMMSLVHHFDDATNRALIQRCARALRPGGIVAIGEAIRPGSPSKATVMDTFFDFYFALTSESGTWTFEEMGSWISAADLHVRRPIRLRFARNVGLAIGEKSP
jgi:predicted O-methyltransferase YrrM